LLEEVVHDIDLGEKVWILVMSVAEKAGSDVV